MPLIGKLSDKFNRKLIITISMPIYILGLFLLIIANPTTLYFAVLGIMMYFLGFTINNLNSQFIVAESTTKSKGLIYGIMFFSYFLGTIGGSILVISDSSLNARAYFEIFIGILAFECLIYGILLSNKTQLIENEFSIDKRVKKENQWKKILRTKTLRSILIFFTLDIFVYGLTLSIYVAGLKSYYNLTVENIAILSMGMNITNMLFQIPAGKITDKIGSKKTLILSQFFGIGFFIMNVLAVSLWSNNYGTPLLFILLVGHISLAISVVTFIPSEQMILTNLDTQRKGESYGIIAFARGLGYIPTGYLGGLIVVNLGYMTLFIFSFCGVILEIIFLLRFFHHHPLSLE